MLVILLRHAPTRGNLNAEYIGATDESLSTDGISLAKKAGANMHVQKVYTSQLLRTIQTSELMYPQAEVVINANLAEINFGRFEGKTAQKLSGDPDYMRWLSSGLTGSCPGGENRRDFDTRCCEAFMEIMEAETKAGSKAAHFVVHGGVIMAIMSKFASPVREYFKWHSGFCGGYKVWYDVASPSSRCLQLLQAIEHPSRKGTA